MIEEAIAYYIDRPVEFAEDTIGVKPDAIQRDIMNSVAKYPLTSVRSGHGIGKSALQAWLIIWFMLTRPYPKIPCTAPTKHQLYDILWAEVAKWQNNNPQLKDELIWTYEKLYLRGYPENWFAVPRTATKPDALQGFHADHVLYIIDEAAGVDDKIFEPVLGALSTKGAKLLMCGNPTSLTGFFFDSHHKNRAMYQTFKVSSESSERVSTDYVKMIIDMFGEDSDVYRVRVAGDFPNAAPDSFIPMAWAERNSKNASTPCAETVNLIGIGVDVARYGDDDSVICPVFDGTLQLKPDVYHHNDTMELTGRVIQKVYSYAEAYQYAEIHVKIDCDGLGVGVYDRLAEQREEIISKVEKEREENGLELPPFVLKIYECHFGGAGGKAEGEQPIEYENNTGIMWGIIRERLRLNTLTLHYDDKQISQLSTRKYMINSNGKIKLERKEDMKKRGLGSPDLADALALAVYEPRQASWDITV